MYSYQSAQKLAVHTGHNRNSIVEKWVSLKFIYSEKATKFCEIFHLLLTVCIVVKSKGKISQNFVAFSEYMNFNFNHKIDYILITYPKINKVGY